MQNESQWILKHYEFKEYPHQVITTYKHKSIAETCTALGIDIAEKPLKSVHESTKLVHPAVFETICAKQDEEIQPFLRIARLPGDVQNKIFTEYVFDGNETAANILRGCSGKKNINEELSYEEAIYRFNQYKKKNISFLTLGEMYCLPEKEVELCESIEKGHADKTARLSLVQEQTLHALPADVKQKMIAYKVLCQRPYKERFWIALRASSETFLSCLESSSKGKTNRQPWEIGIAAAVCLFMGLCRGVYAWFSSGYEFPHAKAVKDI
jgi:hypothetical protein